MNEIDRHNRRVMLQRIKTYWLKGVLEESLHGAELIDLGLAYRPHAVANHNVPGWQQTAAYDIPLPVGTRIGDVFAAAQGQLLVMGEPGAGKTTLLLQLVSDLLARAEQDEQQPVPVVFSLAGWQNPKSLAGWLVDELSNNYEVPRKLGQFWLETNALLPLLDGLDEVDRERRAACADAINAFRQSHNGLSLLVTARSQDYQALATRLNLDKAIVLQPLTPDQIDAYLAGRGSRLAGLRAALRTDATLRELAQTPLMLSIMTLAYYRMPGDAAIALSSREEGRKLLFDVYVERMARYRGGAQSYAPQETLRWLAWLARSLAQQNQTLFFLENMQPNWLPRAAQRRFADGVKFSAALLFLLVGLVAGGTAVPFYGWPGLGVGLGLGALLGLPPLLTGRLLLNSRVNWYKIDTVETLGWSWPWAWLGLGVGGLLGLALGLGVAWLARDAGTAGQVAWPLLLAAFAGASQVVENALRAGEVKLRTTPGQGLARSRRTGWLVGGLSALGTAVLMLLLLAAAALAGVPVNWGANLPWLAGGALVVGLSGGLIYGGLAALQHRRLRAQLRRAGALPDGYVRFLDYAAERSLLRKVGGGYTFMHALLLDYFKQLE